MNRSQYNRRGKYVRHNDRKPRWSRYNQENREEIRPRKPILPDFRLSGLLELDKKYVEPDDAVKKGSDITGFTVVRRSELGQKDIVLRDSYLRLDPNCVLQLRQKSDDKDATGKLIRLYVYSYGVNIVELNNAGNLPSKRYVELLNGDILWTNNTEYEIHINQR